MFLNKPEIKRYAVIKNLTQLKQLQRKMKRLEEFAFDTETNTLRVYGDNDNFRLVGISISWGYFDNYYIPVGHRRVEDMYSQLNVAIVSKYMQSIFGREDVRIIGHNLKFDMHVLARIGVFIQTKDLFDTMIASWICDENTPNGLKENSMNLLHVKQTHFKEALESVTNEIKKEYGLKASNNATFDLVLVDIGAPYALADAFFTWCLYLGFLDLLAEEKMDKIYAKVYVKFIRTLYEMEERGVVVDLSCLEEMSHEINADMDELKYKMYELSGVEFNPSSGAQVAELLFGYQSSVENPEESEGWRKLTDKDKSKAMAKYAKAVSEKENSPILKRSFKFPIDALTKGGAPSTSADTLWTLSRKTFKVKRKQEGVELCKLLMEYKKLAKLSSAFIEGLKEQIYDDGKVHPSFNIIGTDSGRLSCSAPNLQQLPKADEEDKYKIRSLFIGSEYLFDENTDEVIGDYDGGCVTNDNYVVKRKKIVALDFSNLEMRVLAHFSQDENLLEMFEKGQDTHGSTAVNMFGLDCDPSEVKKKYHHLRQAAKIINFMLMYGGGAFSLFTALRDDHDSPIDLGSPDYLKQYKVKTGEEVAQIYIDKYFATYKGVAKFIKSQKNFAHRNGFVYTLLRRKRRLPDINTCDFKEQAYLERLSVNSAIQGSAADITMSAQNRINDEAWFVNHLVYMLIQVHDELVFECPEEYVEEAIIRIQRYMSHPFGDNVELNLAMVAEADSGDSYQEAK